MARRVRRRFAMAIDSTQEAVTLGLLRALVRGADHEGFSDDSQLEYFHDDNTFGGRSFLALNEMETP